jgi:hypothetical protein
LLNVDGAGGFDGDGFEFVGLKLDVFSFGDLVALDDIGLLGGRPMLARARAKARMCAISRVIKNCNASFVPGSRQKFINRS